MPVHRTARERARADITAAIKDEARRQLGQVGANGLSLRAVARELGMVSSALYRYFPSRDDLLTALIVDAYDGLGDAAESAASSEPEPRARWMAICHAVRQWARSHPHEYMLIYGSPVPGYRAPQDTVGPAARVPLALLDTLRAACDSGALREPDAAAPLPAELRAQLDTIATTFVPGLPAPVLDRALVAWTQLFGMISFELTGQYVGSIDPADAFFGHAVERMAAFVGFSPG